MNGSFSQNFAQSKTRTKDLTPQEFQNLRSPLEKALKSLLGKGTEGGFGSLEGIPQYEGDLAAPITGNEQTVLDQLMAANAPGNARSSLIDQTLQGDFLNAQNPFLQSYIQASQRENLRGLEETLTRALPGRFTQGGQFVQPGGSSPFDRAAAIATEGVANANADIASNIGFGAYEAERQRQNEAVALGQQDVELGIQNLQAQALPRLIQEQGIERGTQIFQQNIQALLAVLQIATGAAAPTPAQKSDSFDYSASGSGGATPSGKTK